MAGREDSNLFVEALLPVDVRTFQRSAWEAHQLFVPGWSDKFRHLGVTLEEFRTCVANTPPERLKAARVTDDGRATYDRILPEDAPARAAQGMTLCVTAADDYFRFLQTLSIDAKISLGLHSNGHCNIYDSPTGGGFGLHFDTQSVFILQIEGSKRWRCGSTPAVPFPPELCEGEAAKMADYRQRHRWTELADTERTSWCEYDLVPGDLLYLPPGTWHQGRAGTHSLAVSLTCPTVSAAALIAALLSERFGPSLAWRRNLPSSAVEGLVESDLDERLAELRELVRSLTGAELVQMLRRR